MRRLMLKETTNTRDLGGHPLTLNSCTKYNRFFRSDLPIYLNAEEMDFFVKNNITTVIDLRSLNEACNTKSFFADKPGISYHHIPLSDDGGRPDTEGDIPSSYLAMLERRENIYDIMKIFAHKETGFLFHCTAGKDRTGVVSAVLLMLAGACESDIIADYQVTQTYIKPFLEVLAKNMPDMPAWAGKSKPKYMRQFLKLFLDKYGSINDYLLDLCLTEKEIAAIKDKLIK